jgi:hypothetical protein
MTGLGATAISRRYLEWTLTIEMELYGFDLLELKDLRASGFTMIAWTSTLRSIVKWIDQPNEEG